MNRLVERLGADYNQLFERYDAILTRCHTEGRDPNSGEEVELDQLRSDMNPLGERIVQLRDDETRRQATATALDGLPTPLTPVATSERVRPSPLVCSDHMLRQIIDAVRSRTAFDQPIDGIMTRATVTTPAGAVAPDWLFPVAYGREPRIAERVTNAGGIGTEADWIEITTPAVAAVVAAGAAKPDSGMVLTRESAPYEKLAAWTDATMEILSDFESTQSLINAELLGSVQTLENAEIVAAINGNANILTATVTGTSRLHAILQAQAQVRAGPSKAWPDMVLMNPTDWPSTIGQEAATSGVLQAGAAVVVDGTGTRLWGMDVFLTVQVTAGTAFVGLASAVLFVTRDPAHVVIDPWTGLKSNVVTTVAEERSKAGLQRPQSWAKVTLPAAGTPAAAQADEPTATHQRGR
jgi:HK97 family phage major capsid protein